MSDIEIAKEIFRQIKAMDSWAFGDWGAKDFVGGQDYLQFKTSGMVVFKGIVKIRLDLGKDLYEVEFGQIRKYEYKIRKKFTDIYFDQLIELIDRNVKTDALKKAA